MPINTNVSAQYQSVIELAGTPQNSALSPQSSSGPLAIRPTAAAFGVGTWQDGADAYVSDGVSWYQAAVANAAGDLVANIVPRADTLQSLLSIIGTQGELASATDQAAIVKYAGAVAGGDVIYANDAVGGVSGQVVIHNTKTTAGYKQIDQVALGYQKFKLYGFVNTTGTTIQLTRDGVNFFSVDAPPAPSLLAIEAITGRLIAVPIAADTVAYYSAPPYATWTAFTGATAATAKTLSQPIMCGSAAALAVIVGTGNESVLLDTVGNTATQYSLPSVDTWLVPVAPQFFTADTWSNLAVTAVPSTAKVAIFYKSANVPSWYAHTLPAALGATPVITFTKDKILIGSSGSSIGFVASYTNSAGNITISAFEQVTLPVPSATAALLTANKNNFFIADSTALYYSADGKGWIPMPLSVSGFGVSQLSMTLSGLLVFRGNMELLLYTSFKNFTQLPDFPVNVKKAIGNLSILNGGVGIAKTLFLGGVEPTEALKLVTTTTGTINMAVSTAFLDVNIATQAALTVNLPPNPYNGQQVFIRFAAAITTLTIGTQAAPANQLVNGLATLVTAAAANEVKKLVYSSATLTWSVM